MRPKKKVGLKDVAASLGVSVVTASNALSGKGGVSEENRERIIKKAQELGYVYSPKASKGVKKGDLPRACICYRDRDGGKELPSSGEGAAFLRLLAEALLQAGFQVLTDGAVQNGDVAAAVGFWPEDALRDLRNSFKGPLCAVENFSAHIQADYVVSDRYHAAYEKVKDLYRKGGGKDLFPDFPQIDSGRAREGTAADRLPALCLVLDPQGERWMEADRMEGFLSACFSYDTRGDARRESYLFLDAENGGDILFKGPEAFLLSLSGRESLPDGVLCTNRREAELLSEECRKLGIVFPLGISDCGVPDRKAMAQMTAQVLKKRMQGESPGDSPVESCPEGVHLVREIL